jgi:pimeloyl-ACP methyl ester carboxylesterase
MCARPGAALFAAVTMTALVCTGLAGGSGGQRSIAPPVVSDAVERDPHYPAQLASLQITSHGSALNAILMIAAGPGPHPTVMLLHGFPGYEGLLDVGEAMRRAGFNVLAFHYRGVWGSGGSFSFAHCVEDAAAAMEPLRDPASAKRGRVDASRIYAVGHSMGGFVAVELAARDPNVKGLAYISGWDIGNDAATWPATPPPALVEDFRQSALPTHGTSGAKLIREAMGHAAEWKLAKVASRIADRPILMTFAEFEADDNPPAINHEPLRNALVAAGARSLETRSFPTDHSYSDQRIALASAVVTWLQRVSGTTNKP